MTGPTQILSEVCLSSEFMYSSNKDENSSRHFSKVRSFYICMMKNGSLMGVEGKMMEN